MLSPFLLLGMLAASMFAVVLDDEDLAETDDAPPESDVPSQGDPEVVAGTEADDTLSAQGNQIVNAGGGDDTLNTDPLSDGAVINGDAGADTLTLAGPNGTANGGEGQDTLTAGGIANAALNGGDGDDLIRFDTTLDPDAPAGGTAAGGGGEDTITATGIGGLVRGGAGEDLINVQGSMTEVSGGDGNDTIIADTADYGGGSPISGDAGNDTLQLLRGAGFQIGAMADGGAGDDLIQTTSLLNTVGATDFDTLTGGDGADQFELTFQESILGGGSYDAGIVTQITDFDPAEDVLAIETAIATLGVTGTAANATVQDFDLIEADDGSYTDVVFNATANGGTAVLTGAIRLSGVSGLTDAGDAIILIT